MNFFTRLSNGWQLALNSFSVLKANRQLIIFPILSAIAMLLAISTFVVAMFASAGWDAELLREQSTGTVANYAILFLYYLVNYFIVVFFNTALVHCTHLYFNGEEPTVAKGLRFALGRIGAIFSWAIFAATVGTILRAIQDKVGTLGKVITGLIGIVWSVATFFVVPIIAYENLGPIAAFKRSASLMKEKWGESIGASFSFGIIQFLAILLLAVPSLVLGWLVHPIAGAALFAVGVFAIVVLFSAAKVIFVSAVYHDINGDPVKVFNQHFADNLFEGK
jgi:hypothetical protein